MVGCSVAGVLAGFPGCDVQLVDTTPPAPGWRGRSTSVVARGRRGGCDLVVHASATDARLARSLGLLAPEGEVVG